MRPTPNGDVYNHFLTAQTAMMRPSPNEAVVMVFFSSVIGKKHSLTIKYTFFPLIFLVESTVNYYLHGEDIGTGGPHNVCP
jgi:hypothetical protein